MPAAIDLGFESPIAVDALKIPPDYGETVDGQISWGEIVRFVRDESGLGDFRLAFLETLVRNADEIASSRIH